jgi:hypothetical protein
MIFAWAALRHRNPPDPPGSASPGRHPYLAFLQMGGQWPGMDHRKIKLHYKLATPPDASPGARYNSFVVYPE